MPTTRRFVCAGTVTFASIWAAQDGGDAPTFLFTEGAWVFDWDGTYNISVVGNLGAQIVVSMGGFYEVPLPEVGGDPPVATLQATIQALIDAGATITSIGGSISGSAPGDLRISMISPSAPTTLAQLAAMQWTLTVASTSPPGSLFVGTTSGNITLEIPDAPTFEYTGEGGVDVSGEALGLITSPTDSEEPPMLELFMEGGVDVSGGDDNILSVDVSGIYTIVKDKTNDTLYNRTAGGEETSLVVKIPDPFVRTGFFGG